MDNEIYNHLVTTDIYFLRISNNNSKTVSPTNSALNHVQKLGIIVAGKLKFTVKAWPNKLPKFFVHDEVVHQLLLVSEKEFQKLTINVKGYTRKPNFACI